MRNFPQLATFVIAGLVVATNVQAFSPSAIDLPTLNLSAGEGIDFNGNTVNITSGYVLRKNQVESTDQNFSFTGNQVLVDGNLSVGGGSTTPSEVLVVNGNIVPATGNTGSLGTASNPWKDLYVSSSTIFVGNLRLQDVGGSLSIVNEETPEANVGIIVGSSEGTTEVVSQEGGGIATSSLPDGGDWTLDTDLNLIASGTLDNIISIGADGNVGIGTTNPQSPLVVGDNFANFGPDTVLIGNSDGNSSLYLGKNASYYGGIQYNHTGQYLGLRYKNSVDYGTPLVIAANGNVGIGTTNPGAKLEVSSTGAGNMFTLDNTQNAGWMTIKKAGTANGYLGYGGTAIVDVAPSANDIVLRSQSGLVFATGGGNTRAVISNNGNVGIGTTAPGLKLETKGTVGLPATSGTAQTGIMRLSQTGTGIVDFGFGGTAGYGWIQATDSTNLATSYGLLLNPNGGNVGIGTTTPKRALHVETDISTAPIRFEGSNGWVELQIIDGSSCSAGWVKIGEDGGNSFCFDSGG